MSTPNTPAPGTPEWLRDEAKHRECRGDPVEIPAGLRAAAERIEQLERASKDLIALAAESDEENDRLRVELVVLRDEKAGIHASEANYIRQCAELSDENAELKRVQDALKKEVAAANKGARINALVNESLLAKERELRAENEALRADRERLDWLETQDCWIGIVEGDDVPRRVAAGGSYYQSVRPAIDAARKEGST